MNKYLKQAQAELEVQHQLARQQFQKLEKLIQENSASWAEQSLWRQAEEKVWRIDQARKLVHEGCYGTCQTCGTDIAPERLLAIPEATECISCSRNAAKKHTNKVVHSYQPIIA